MRRCPHCDSVLITPRSAVARAMTEWLDIQPVQAGLLEVLLAAAPGEGVTNRRLAVRGNCSLNAVKVQVCILRKVLPPDSITTLYGHGYRLTPAGRDACLKALALHEQVAA